MAEKKLASYFLSHLRLGLAARAEAHANPQSPGKRAKVNVQLEVKMGNTAKVVDKPIEIYGPGDVLGFNAERIVAKIEPEKDVGIFEPNYMPYIEFAEPDFLWRYSAAKSADGKKWLPWLALIVLKAGEGEEAGEFVPLDPEKPGLPPAIQLTQDAVLPDLRESWRWAHVQVDALEGLSLAQVKDVILLQPGKAVCRLLCPRKLMPCTSYTAFVIPVFQLGVDAALGVKDSTADRLQLAWGAPGQASIRVLPYYFRWDFRTGWKGDFEYLVRELEPRRLSGLGLREIDCSGPGYGLKKAIEQDSAESGQAFLMKMEGALMSLDAQLQQWGMDDAPNYPNAVQQKLAELLNQAEVINDQGEVELRVVPPIYGRWHVAGETADFDLNPADRNWLNELNLDFRHRAAAGMGVEIIKEHQEAFMESAWKQLGEVQKVNRDLNLGRFARQVSLSMHKRLEHLKTGALLQLTLPLKSKIKMGKEITPQEGEEALTLAAGYEASALPDTLTNVKARKYLEKCARDARRQNRQVARSRSLYAGMGADGHIFARAANLEIVKPELRPDGLNDQEVNDIVQGGASQRLAATRSLPAEARREFVPPPFDVHLLEEAVFEEGINPRQTIEKRMANRIARFRARQMRRQEVEPETSVASLQQADPLRPVIWHPEFHQPMYRYLRDKAADLLIPGLGDVPHNTIALLAANRRFIEAFMMGLNHEFAAELRWREYPTDMRGSYFRSFWDTTIYSVSPEERELFRHSPMGQQLLQTLQAAHPGKYPSWIDIEKAYAEQTDRVAAAQYEEAVEAWLLTREEDKDIRPLATWGVQRRLGAHGVANDQAGDSPSNLVILLRGELLHKYPHTKIYLAQVKKDRTGQLIPNLEDEGKKVFPIFEGVIPSDVAFIGFPVPQQLARKYFIVFQEEVAELRFGLDLREDADETTLAAGQLDDLSWQHFSGLPAEGYLDGAKPLSLGNEWDNAAFIAQALVQKKVRVAIQLDRLIPQPADFVFVIDVSQIGTDKFG